MAAPESAPLRPLGWVLVAAGLALVVWTALLLAAAGYGSAPVRSFAERRSYDMVKTNVREVFPRALLQGGAGLVLALLGSRLRRRA